MSMTGCTHYVAMLIKEQIVWLHITMHHALAVGVRQALCSLLCVVDDLKRGLEAPCKQACTPQPRNTAFDQLNCHGEAGRHTFQTSICRRGQDHASRLGG
jgi:hypothetical protein